MNINRLKEEIVKRIALCLLLFTLVACAPTVMVKPGATEADFARDKAECEYEAMKASPSNPGVPLSMGLGAAFNQSQIFHKCLELKGWYPQK